MKRSLTTATVLILALGFSTAFISAEVTRTLEADVPVSRGTDLVIENLIGSMKVVPGSGDTVRMVAIVHAEDEELAGLVSISTKPRNGKTHLRVEYPLDKHSTIRVPKGLSVTASSGFLDRWFGGGGTKYGDHTVRFRDRKGVLLYADVEVQVPALELEARFSNLVGSLHAERVSGNLQFETHQGDIRLHSLRGEISTDMGSGNTKAKDIEGSFSCDSGSGDCDLEDMRGEAVTCDTGSGQITLRSVKVSGRIQADTGSGDVHGQDLEGSFECNTGSGDCTLDGLSGKTVTCDTGSGTVRLRSVTADRIRVDTGSGDVFADGINAREFRADTGSGDVHISTSGDRLTRVTADTGSGNVKVGLQADASFELRASTGSGDIISRFEDAQALVEGKEVIGYRRGEARIKLTIDTGSGNVIVEPTGKK